MKRQIQAQVLETPASGLETVHYRIQVANDLVRWHRKTNIYLCVGMIISTAIIAALLFFRPSPKYFAVSDDGRVIKMEPLDKPLMSNAAFLSWTERIVRDAYSLNFLEIDEQVQLLSDRLSSQAHAQWIQALVDQGMWGTIKNKRLVMQASTEPGTILSKSMREDGALVIDVEVKARVKIYHGVSSKTSSRTVTVFLRAVRVDARLRPQSGMVITKFLSKG